MEQIPEKGGFIAVSEASWFTSERPAEIEDFWMGAYPEISVIPTCIDKMERAGYTPTAHFILPENCWTEHYFAPQDEVRETFMKEHVGNKTAMDFMKGQQYERSLYSKYKDYYGYVFYIGQKDNHYLCRRSWQDRTTLRLLLFFILH